MEHEEFLVGIAQVAVTLAGFSGLVIAIRGAPSSEWHARDIWSLSWMFGTSFGALFLSLLPVVLGSFRLSDDLVWRISNAVMSIFVICFTVPMLIWGYQLTKAGHPPRVRFFPSIARLLLLASGIFGVAQTLGFFPNAGTGFFITSLMACLLVSAFSLVVFLIVFARAAARRV
jgi:hypothetical protein